MIRVLLVQAVFLLADCLVPKDLFCSTPSTSRGPRHPGHRWEYHRKLVRPNHHLRATMNRSSAHTYIEEFLTSPETTAAETEGVSLSRLLTFQGLFFFILFLYCSKNVGVPAMLKASRNDGVTMAHVHVESATKATQTFRMVSPHEIHNSTP